MDNIDYGFYQFVKYYNELNLTNKEHQHSKDVEIIYIIDGQVNAYINGNLYIGQAGDLFVLNIGDYHYTTGFYGANSYVSLINSEHLKIFFNDLPQIKNHITYEEQVNSGIENQIPFLLNLIYKHCCNTNSLNYSGNIDLYDKNIIYSSFTMLYSIIAKTFTVNNLSVDTTIKKDIINKIVNFINENYNQSVTLNDLAEEINYSIGYTSKLFKKVMNSTFKKELILARIEHACNMLITTNYSIEDISYKCNFNTSRAFYKQFKSVTNMTPTEYRQKNKK